MPIDIATMQMPPKLPNVDGVFTSNGWSYDSSKLRESMREYGATREYLFRTIEKRMPQSEINKAWLALVWCHADVQQHLANAPPGIAAQAGELKEALDEGHGRIKAVVPDFGQPAFLPTQYQVNTLSRTPRQWPPGVPIQPQRHAPEIVIKFGPPQRGFKIKITLGRGR